MRVLLLALMVTACAPMHIQEHQADGVSGRCGFGASGLFLQDSPFVRFAVEVEREKEELVVDIFMQGRDGERLTVLDKAMTARFDGQVTTAPIEATTAQTKNDPADHPRQGVLPAGASYEFKKDGDYFPGRVRVRARFPFSKSDFEVDTVRVRLNDREVNSQPVRFHYVDRWTITPLNGC